MEAPLSIVIVSRLVEIHDLTFIAKTDGSHIYGELGQTSAVLHLNYCHRREQNSQRKQIPL